MDDLSLLKQVKTQEDLQTTVLHVKNLTEGLSPSATIANIRDMWKEVQKKEAFAKYSAADHNTISSVAGFALLYKNGTDYAICLNGKFYVKGDVDYLEKYATKRSDQKRRTTLKMLYQMLTLGEKQ